MATYTQSQVDEAIRKTLTPYKYVSYLPEDTPYTTPTFTANVPTKLLVPTTIKTVNGFALEDMGGGNIAVRYKGLVTTMFTVVMTTGMRSGSNNIVLNMYMYKNGVPEPGISTPRKIGTGSDVGAVTLSGEFEVSPNDYIELYAKVSNNSNIVFEQTSIVIVELN